MDSKLRDLAIAAYNDAKASGMLASLDEGAADTMARDIAGDDPLVYAAVMDDYDTQTILAGRDAIVQSYAAEESAMHDATRASMVRVLGLSPAEYEKALADEDAGGPSTLLAMKEAYVFR